MIVTCNICAQRLQIDDAKVPSRPFTVRCPKCQNVINAAPPISENGHGALSVGGSPASENPRFEQPSPAPAFKLEEGAEECEVKAYAEAQGSEANELIRLLTALLQRGAPVVEKTREATRLAWERRRVLICVSLIHREAIARKLVEHDYQVFVAEDVGQALERMREEGMDIVILDPDFDSVEQGAAYVMREVNTLRPAARRRLFFALLSSSVRTMDQHAAFVNSFNMVVNPDDIEHMPRALERMMRDFNDLYRELNNALNVAAL
jgi:predicted Zn finger-like uncharacterized protein